MSASPLRWRGPPQRAPAPVRVNQGPPLLGGVSLQLVAHRPRLDADGRPQAALLRDGRGGGSTS